tara:strand:+ start:6265 stop:6549 length:285 start_codon:yes stop_codon:yes gene_type:complete
MNQATATAALDTQDQLESRLERADAMLRLLTSTSDVDAHTLQVVALDVAEHVQEARQLCQQLACQQKGPAPAGQPLSCMSCLTVRLYQRRPAAL